MPQVMEGMEAALEAGLSLANAVALRGINDKELVHFVEYARKNPVDVLYRICANGLWCLGGRTLISGVLQIL